MGECAWTQRDGEPRGGPTDADTNNDEESEANVHTQQRKPSSATKRTDKNDASTLPKTRKNREKFNTWLMQAKVDTKRGQD